MLKPVHALVGAELLLQLETLAELLRIAPHDVQRVDFEGETAELSDVLDEVRSFAMFSSRKIVIVRDADEFVSRFREPLEAYVAKPTAESSLVLRLASLPTNQRIYKAIAANGQIHNCSTPKDITTWILQRARNTHKLTLTPDAATVLLDLVGTDLCRLDNELAKLALHTDGKINPAAIEQTVSFQREQEMWHLTDALGTGNIHEAIHRWRHLVQLNSSAEFRAVTWLGLWLEKVRKALIMKRQGLSEYAIAKDLKIWPASQQKAFFQTAAAIGETGVARLINLLAELDYRSKSGLGDMTQNVERFILSLR